MLYHACLFNFLLLFKKTKAATGKYNCSEDPFGLFAKVPKFRETKYVQVRETKRIERNFMDEEKWFSESLLKINSLRRRMFSNLLLVRFKGFDNIIQNRISRRSYTGLWKVIIVWTWPLCESESFQLLKK